MMSATLTPAARCDGCRMVTYNVARTALLVGGSLRSARDLCPACRVQAVEAFEAAQKERA